MVDGPLVSTNVASPGPDAEVPPVPTSMRVVYGIVGGRTGVMRHGPDAHAGPRSMKGGWVIGVADGDGVEVADGDGVGVVDGVGVGLGVGTSVLPLPVSGTGCRGGHG